MGKGWVTLNVREEIKENLERMHQEDINRPDNQKFGSWLDNFLGNTIENQERTKKYGKLMVLEHITEKYVTIRDHLKSKPFTVSIYPEKRTILYCQEDHSKECIHVGFALALPEVYKMLIKRGYHPNRMLII